MNDGIVRLVVNSDPSMLECNKTIHAMYREHKHLTLSIRPGADRSIEQNQKFTMTYKEIAKQREDITYMDARAHCKLYIGIPILQRDCEGFDKSFKAIFGQLSTEAALRLMGPNNLFPVDGFPVTRNFSTRQGKEYIDEMERYWGEIGIIFQK